MTFSVMTNANALAALESLTVTQHSLSQAQARISSGLKVASAADAPSTFAIAQGMRGDIAGFQSIGDSIALAQNVVTVASQAAQTVTNDLNQLKGSVVSAQDPTQNKADIQDRVTALLNEIQATVNAAQFNGVNILNSPTGQGGLDVNVAFNRTGTNGANVSVSTMNLTQQDLSFKTGALQSIANLNVASTSANVATFNLGSTPAISGNDVFTIVTNPTGPQFVPNPAISLTNPANYAAVPPAANAPTIVNPNWNPAVPDQTYSFEFIDTSGATGAAQLQTPADATHHVIQVNFDSTKDSPQAAIDNAFTAMQQQGFAGSFSSNGSQFTLSGTNVISAGYVPSPAGIAGALNTATGNATSTIAGYNAPPNPGFLAPGAPGGPPALPAVGAGVAEAGAMGGNNLLTTVENAINSVNNVMAQIGAFQNELQDQSTFVKALTDALTTGVGNLVDADMAAESANLQASQTRQSLGIQALSIANQGPSALMQLFR